MGSGARLIVAQNTNLLETINSLIARIAVLEQKLAKVTVSNDTNNIYFTGVNLNVISGSESTDGPVNGLGNIIVGYHENDLFNNSRTSSHNIVVGNYHGYPSYGGIVGDIGNVISGNSLFAVGNTNTASGQYSSVSGGVQNVANGYIASVFGGGGNTASNQSSSITGGYGNIANNTWSSISGGQSNTASGVGASVSGGYQNIALGSTSSVAGGSSNTASGATSSIAGGL